jgi:protein FRA10AC1
MKGKRKERDSEGEEKRNNLASATSSSRKSQKSSSIDTPRSSDALILASQHEFVREDERDSERMKNDWRVRMARSHYDRLYKEYALADLSRADVGAIGLRWRVEAEVLSGKGQTICGSLSCCGLEGLTSFEVPFKYGEGGKVKCELVKLRLCGSCGPILEDLRRRSDRAKEKQRSS